MLGVPLGALLSTFLKEKYPRADPIICGAGLFLSSLFIFATFFYARVNIFMGFAFVFLGEIALNLNWSIVADILLVRGEANIRGIGCRRIVVSLISTVY